MSFIKKLAFSLLISSVAFAGPVFPYQGRLDKNGAPQSGLFNMQFALFSSPTGGTALWSDTLNAVTVVAGAFSVKLGAGLPISQDLLTSGDLYLEVSVQGAADSGFRKLVGRQQLLNVPYAATSSGSFKVNGQLTVGVAPDGGAIATESGYAEVITGQVKLTTPASGSVLVVDGKTIQSNTTLQLQPAGNLATSVGGALNVTGPVNAPNTWSKVYSGNVFIAANGNVTINGLNTSSSTVYKIYVQGEIFSTSTAYLTLRIGNLTSGYRTFFSWLGDNQNGETNGNASGLYIARNGNNTTNIVVGDYQITALLNVPFVASVGHFTQFDEINGGIYSFVTSGKIATGSFTNYSSMTFHMDAAGSFGGEIQVWASP